MSTQEIADIFYPHWLAIQIKRRQEALELLATNDFRTLRLNYGHYCTQTRKSQTLTNTDLICVIEELTSIKEGLPINASDTTVSGAYNEEEQEPTIFVEWIEYSIPDEKKCESLAMHWAKDDAWKMKHQPNGIDGKKAQELYNKLTNA